MNGGRTRSRLYAGLDITKGKSNERGIAASKQMMLIACLSSELVLFCATESFTICDQKDPFRMGFGEWLGCRIGNRASTHEWMLALAIWLALIGFALSPSSVAPVASWVGGDCSDRRTFFWW